MINIQANHILDLIADTRKDGGATLHLRDYTLDERYVVCDGELGLTYSVSGSVDTKLITHMARYWQTLGYDVIRAWIDEGTLYLDPATLCSDEDEATRLGEKRDEIAIYDLLDCVTIDILH